MFALLPTKPARDLLAVIVTIAVAGGMLTMTTPQAGAGILNTMQNAADEEPAGEVVALVNGRHISLPLLKADYNVDVEGNVATVVLTQTFLNTSPVPLNARYLFPLNQKSAVFAMEMKVGEEVIKAIIKRKEDAKKTFKAAKQAGKTASLLTQHRPNMFTQDIANLMPGKPVSIRLSYLQKIPKIDDAYELVIPMVVGPRYEGRIEPPLADSLGIDDQTPIESDESSARKVDATINVSGWNIDKLPAYPGIIGHNAPGIIDPKRVALSLKLEAATPISGVYSHTHALKIEGDEKKRAIKFEQGRVIDNRDLILRYELSQQRKVAAGILSHHDERGGFLSLAIEPPKMAAEKSITPRELVFVLDTSGSMGGQPIDASKAFMEAALSAMRPTDYFRILRFSNNTSHFATGAVRATPSNVKNAQHFVSGLSASGGTELNNAINAAFDTVQPQGTMRIVVFLTDGYIGSDRHVIKTVANRIGDARIYAFGVGNSVNRFLLDGMAREGRGRARYVGIGETASEAALALAGDLRSPLLTDIEINWNGLTVSQQTPARIPDLFSGGGVNVYARYDKPGQHRIFLEGLVNGRKASLPIDINLAARANDEPSPKGNAIPLLWARETIFNKNREYTIGGAHDSSLSEEITQLGLEFSLQSRFTSFVAVSKKVYNKTPEQAKSAMVPLPKVLGVSTGAYASLNLSGSSTPEPEALFGLAMAVMMALLRYWKKITRYVSRNWPNRTASNQTGKKQLPRGLLRDGWWIELQKPPVE